MKFTFFSKYGDSLSLAKRVQDEGNIVNFYCEEKGIGHGIVHTVTTPVVEPDTVLLFDDARYGKRCDEYRRSGYPVVGASTFGNNLELISDYNESVCRLMDQYEMPQNTHVEGWFNGDDWIVGMTSLTVYDTHFLAGDLGRETGYEAGVSCFWKRIRPEMFKATLGKLTSALRKIEFVGPIRYNKRLHTGFTHDNVEGLLTLVGLDNGKLLADVARGNLKRITPSYDFVTVIRVSTPPYPYERQPFRGLVGTGTSASLSRMVALQKAEKLAEKEKQYRVDAGLRGVNTIPRILKENGKRQ